MIILLSGEASADRALSLELANATYPQTTMTLLNAQTTFVNSCSKMD
jgi:hypothetical protein